MLVQQLLVLLMVLRVQVLMVLMVIFGECAGDSMVEVHAFGRQGSAMAVKAGRLRRVMMVLIVLER